MPIREPLDKALVTGYLANDPEAIVLVAFVAANADPGSFDYGTDHSSAASYVKPLAKADESATRSLLFEIDMRDPDTEECHSFSSRHESEWRAMLDTLRQHEWVPIPSILVVVGEVGGPAGYRTANSHIVAA